MQLPDGSVLVHAGAPYDPAKAHAYYLKYRRLHPRSKSGQISTPHGFTVRTGAKTSVRLSSQQLAEQKVYAARRVANIQHRLVVLNAKLREKVAAAKASEAKANLPMTAAEKAKAARESKAFRDKHHQELANKAKTAAAKKPAPAPKTDTIASLRTQIEHTKAALTAEVQKQRELITAKRNG